MSTDTNSIAMYTRAYKHGLAAGIIFTLCLCSLTACSGPPPQPPTIPAGQAVSFHCYTDEVYAYDLTAEQAAFFVALVNSQPTSVVAPETERPTADPPGYFTDGKFHYHFHGSLQYTDADGTTFVWSHPFLSEQLWLPPSEAELPAVFEKMSDYDWPGE